MARVKEKEQAIKLRLDGKSYSEIKKIMGISKSTLSGWLSSYPLSDERIRELRDKNPQRIEKFRNTMKKKKDERLFLAYNLMKEKLGKISRREIFIGGLFLYWAEGGKTASSTIALGNTDPSMLRFYLRWLSILGVNKKYVRAKLQIYSDMDAEKTTRFWAKELGLSINCFTKPYVKKSNLLGLSYKNGFGFGTCMIRCYDQTLWNKIMMGIKYLGDSCL